MKLSTGRAPEHCGHPLGLALHSPVGAGARPHLTGCSVVVVASSAVVARPLVVVVGSTVLPGAGGGSVVVGATDGGGDLVYRLDKVAFGNLSPVRPVPLTLSEFLSDTQSIGRAVVVGA